MLSINGCHKKCGNHHFNVRLSFKKLKYEEDFCFHFIKLLLIKSKCR